MAEPASFEALDRVIGAALDAKTTNFFELAEMLGLDPKQFRCMSGRHQPRQLIAILADHHFFSLLDFG
jgi:nitrogen regulatory protein PII-like uncharacterized protein